MPRLLLVLALALAGCGLAFELRLPVFDTPPHVVRGTVLQRTLYAGACAFDFGQTLVGVDDPCVAELEAETRTALRVPSVEFFGEASARLFVNSWDEMNAFEVAPAEPWQFDGIVEYYADELGADPLYAEWIYSDVEEGASYAPCDFVDRYGYTHEVADATRSATWEDAHTRLDLTEDACDGLVTLRFTDLDARP